MSGLATDDNRVPFTLTIVPPLRIKNYLCTFTFLYSPIETELSLLLNAALNKNLRLSLLSQHWANMRKNILKLWKQ